MHTTKFSPPRLARSVLVGFSLPTSSHSIQRRWNSTVADAPPAGGHLPSVATSQILRTTRDSALRTPGLTFPDEDASGPSRAIIGGRETRKMNTYQAVRDAMRYVKTYLLHSTSSQLYPASRWQKTTPLSSLERMLPLAVSSDVPW